MEQEKIKVLIIDDSIAWVKQLSILLNMEDDMVVVGAAHDVKTGYELVELFKPDVIILDLYFDGDKPEGLTLIPQIRDKAKIIITTMSENPEHAKEAILSGAKEFVIKESVGKLPVTIREVYKRWTTAEIMADVARTNEKIAEEKRKDDILTQFGLTAKEKEVFKCLENDLNRIQISEILCVTIETVRNHITNILVKLSTSNTKKAVEKINESMNHDTL